jgi:hypothetical protein
MNSDEDTRWGLVAGFYECGNEPSDSIKGKTFYKLSDHHFLKKDSASCS